MASSGDINVLKLHNDNYCFVSRTGLQLTVKKPGYTGITDTYNVTKGPNLLQMHKLSE